MTTQLDLQGTLEVILHSEEKKSEYTKEVTANKSFQNS